MSSNLTWEWLAMGGYGLYVWGSMGVSLLALLLEVWTVRLGRQHALQAVCAVMDAQQERDVSMGDALQDPHAGGIA
jgi:heme exporter protein D